MSYYIPPMVIDDLIRTVAIFYTVLAPISRVKITSVLPSRAVVFRKHINVVEKNYSENKCILGQESAILTRYYRGFFLTSG